MSQSLPFKSFGTKLKRLREAAKESLAEVSGAVEVDTEFMQKIETGELQPSEDLVLLLISHFELPEEDAIKLWQLAGFESKEGFSSMTNDENAKHAQSDVMVMPMDARIVYTDMVHVMVNNYGVVMNFMQGAGPDMKPLAIARVGMSKEHAKSVLKVLQETLEMSERPNSHRQLPESQQKESDS